MSKIALLYQKSNFFKIINLKTKFQFNKCNLWEENEQKLWWTHQPTDRQTAVNQYALPSSKEGIKIQRGPPCCTLYKSACQLDYNFAQNVKKITKISECRQNCRFLIIQEYLILKFNCFFNQNTRIYYKFVNVEYLS